MRVKPLCRSSSDLPGKTGLPALKFQSQKNVEPSSKCLSTRRETNGCQSLPVSVRSSRVRELDIRETFQANYDHSNVGLNRDNVSEIQPPS
jgi:hypothetical protein